MRKFAKNFLVLLITILCLSPCAAHNSDEHLRAFTTMINSRNFSGALYEMPLIEDWTNDDDLPDLNMISYYTFIKQISTYRQYDVWKIYPLDSLFVYTIPYVDKLVQSCQTKEEYKKAYTIIYESFKRVETHYGRMHPFYSSALKSMAIVSEALHKPIVAGKFYLKLGQLYVEQGLYREALDEYLQAYPLLKDYKEGVSAEYEVLFKGMTNVYLLLGEYKKAKQYSLLSQDIALKLYGDSSLSYGQAVYNIGITMQNNGQYQDAKPYILEARKILTGHQDTAHIAMCDVCLGEIYQKKGEYDLALTEYSKAVGLLEKYSKGQIEALGEAYNHIAGYYIEIGDQGKALNYLLKSEKVFEQVLPNVQLSPAYATTEENIWQTYLAMGQFQKAAQRANTALSIKKNLFGENHEAYAVSLKNIGQHYLVFGLTSPSSSKDSILDMAEFCYLRALDLLDSLHYYNQDRYTAICDKLGELYYYREQYNKALHYQMQVVNKCPNPESYMHIQLVWSLTRIGLCYYKLNDPENAVKYLKKATDKFKDVFIQTWDFMSENMREKFWETNTDLLSLSIPPVIYNYYPTKPEISQWAYDNELFLKGVMVSSTEMIKHSVVDSGDTLLQRQWNDLAELKNTIYYKEERNTPSLEIEKDVQKAEQLEQEITAKSAVYRDYQFILNTTWRDVRKHLKKNEIAIEFHVVPLIDSMTVVYCALLLRDTCHTPVLIPMFDYRDFIKKCNVSEDKGISYLGNEYDISQYVWRNILPYLKKGETVYFAPSGLLHQVAIENLPYDSTETMNDVFNMVRVSSTRELVSHPKSRRNKTAVLYGGIKYDVSNEDLAEQSAQYKPFASRSLGNDTIDRGRAMFLKGTKEEIIDIQQSLQVKHISVLQYTDLYANEESFKALSGTHTNIIHIATHGFYWEDYKAKKEKFFSQRSSDIGGEIPRKSSIDPLDRCGLLFAGANTALSGHSDRLPEGVQDGILTAKEISTMDLRDADIVVLSACETGLGDISGEGVFGLQRAFKMAGVRSILMALWKVDDKATQILMTSFYRHYTKGKTKREALRLAQQEVRKSGYTDPSYWAGFILLD